MHDDASAELIVAANLAVAQGLERGALYAQSCSFRQQGWGVAAKGARLAAWDAVAGLAFEDWFA